ncbi:MAG: LexA family protein, partial [Erysipelotrichaceae bacterium]
LLYQDLLSTTKVPILGVVRAGLPNFSENNVVGYESVEKNEYSTEHFYLRVKGDSMIDIRIHDGDLVYIKKQNYLNNNEIGVVMINDEVTLKRVKIDENNIYLLSENKKYPPMEYNLLDNQVHILGKLIHCKIMY